MRWSAVLALAAPVFAGCGKDAERRVPDEPARCRGEPVSATGKATYYDARASASGRTGACSFEAVPDERMVVALNGPDYQRAAWCGACLEVRGPAGDVVVRVVDKCPGCEHGDLDLSREAFARIATPSAGRVRVAWRVVECPVSGPIAYHVKSGSNAHWFAVQLRNHRHAIAAVEAQNERGYRSLARTEYNYFVASGGLGAGPYTLRVTDVYGQVLEDALALEVGEARPGAAQFPPCRPPLVGPLQELERK